MFNGETLRLLRNWKGLAQKQAASLMKMSQPGYCKLEKKIEITGKMKEKIKIAFKCSDADIEMIENLPPPPLK